MTYDGYCFWHSWFMGLTACNNYIKRPQLRCTMWQTTLIIHHDVTMWVNMIYEGYCFWHSWFIKKIDKAQKGNELIELHALIFIYIASFKEITYLVLYEWDFQLLETMLQFFFTYFAIWIFIWKGTTSWHMNENMKSDGVWNNPLTHVNKYTRA
jgi:hypothetical protein